MLDFITGLIDIVAMPALGFALGTVFAWWFFGRVEYDRGRSEGRESLRATHAALEAAQGKVEVLETKLAAEKGNGASMSRELHEAREALAEIEDRLAQANGRAGTLEEQLRASEEQLDLRDLRLEDRKQELARLESLPRKVAELETAVADLTARAARAGEERDGALARSRSLEEQLAAQEEALAETHAQAKAALEAASVKRVEQMEEELARSRQAVREREGTISHFRAEIEQLKQRVAAGVTATPTGCSADGEGAAPAAAPVRARSRARAADSTASPRKASVNGEDAAPSEARKGAAAKSALSAPLDPLQRISGISPALEKKLHKAGVYTFAQIAGWQGTDIEAVAGRIGMPASRIKSQQWVSSAKRLLARPRQTKS